MQIFMVLHLPRDGLFIVMVDDILMNKILKVFMIFYAFFLENKKKTPLLTKYWNCFF